MKARCIVPLAGIWLFAGAGCSLLGGSTPRGAADDGPRASSTDLHRRYPQLAVLERKMDRASAHFYFGEHELAAAEAGDLVEGIEDLRAMHPDFDLCDHLEYLEGRAMSLLQRLADDELEKSTTPHVAALIDSLARCVAVEEEIEIEFNAKTNHWVAYFRGSGRKHFARWLARVGEYRGVIEPILVEVGVPRDLLYLAVIESGLNLSARSSMKAVGPWQFMAGTAHLFGLRINWWIDERKDIVASTYAAANYLKYLYDIFGSWPLALAAYNAGEHRVAYAVMRQRTSDYWRLRLPAQTAWFVPKYMAALAIGRDPEAYGFEMPVEAPPSFDIVDVERPTELRTIADAAGCSLAEIKALNPHFKKWSTPPDMIVEVKVPRGTGLTVAERLAGLKPKDMVTFVQHRVKRGETLSSIAAQYDVTIKDIKKINDMGKSNTIRADNILLLPVKDLQRSARMTSKPSYRSPERSPQPPSLRLLSSASGERAIRYIVKKDDTIVKIAERFNAHIGDLRAWNGLTHESIVKPGDTLLVQLVPDRGGSDTDADGGDSAREEKWVVHVVRKGDTLSSISKRYNARLSDILAWNNKTARSTLFPGDRIRIRVDVD